MNKEKEIENAFQKWFASNEKLPSGLRMPMYLEEQYLPVGLSPQEFIKVCRIAKASFKAGWEARDKVKKK